MRTWTTKLLHTHTYAHKASYWKSLVPKPRAGIDLPPKPQITCLPTQSNVCALSCKASAHAHLSPQSLREVLTCTQSLMRMTACPRSLMCKNLAAKPLRIHMLFREASGWCGLAQKALVMVARSLSLGVICLYCYTVSPRFSP